jgi:hypothetical protein
MRRISLFIPLCLLLVTACQPAMPPSETSVPSPTLLPTATTAPTALPGILYVEPNTTLGPISPYLYGSNAGPANVIPVEMLDAAYNAGITALRGPGGAWGDNNVFETYHIDQFINLCKKMNAMPTLNVRLKNGTPETAAEMVRYTNIEKGYGVTYWGIGNEPTLYEAEMGETYDTVRFNQEWRAIALAMKAVDPSIKVMGPELHQWGVDLASTLSDSSGRDWMTEFLKANGDLVDVVTVHRYPLWTSGRPVTIEEMRTNIYEWTQMVTYLRGLIQEYTGRDIPIAFTEVNSSPTAAQGGVASPDSFYNAIWYADVLGELASQRVFMVNNWVLADRNGGLGLIKGSELRPIFYVFEMYKHFGNQLVYAASGMENVTIYAAKREDATLTIMIINLSDTEQRVPLQVTGGQPVRADLWRLDASHNAEHLGPQDLPADGVLILPVQSVTLYVFGQ